MDFQHDKKFLADIVAFLKDRRLGALILALIWTIWFSASTDEEFRILDRFDRDGWLAFGLLLIPPYWIVRLARDYNLRNSRFRLSISLSILLLIFSAALLFWDGRSNAYIAGAIFANIPLFAYWLAIVSYLPCGDSKSC